MNAIGKFHTEDLKVRASACITTELVKSAASIHNTSPVATMALGRVLTGAALLAAMKASNQKVGIRVSGDGPLGELYADASFEGDVRGYCQHPQAAADSTTLDVPKAVGQGTLTVLQSVPHQRQPQQGIVPIVSGEISPDLAHYLKQSYQIPSVIALTVSLDEHGQVTHAGGVLVEVLPGATESFLSDLETIASQAPPLSTLLPAAKRPSALLAPYLHESPLVELEHDSSVQYACPCSAERVERTLLLLGAPALSEMALKGEPVPVRCEFCGESYVVAVERIREILLEMKTNQQPN